VIGALRGGAGKTTLAVGILAALRRRGLNVVPFKKGPDYIDAAWLSAAAGISCRNLDTFLMGADRVRASFRRYASPSGLALIEGNRGLYDGLDAAGSHSTAELAKLLTAPVVLVMDSDKVTRTAAAMILGCQRLDPAVNIRGVILNRTARSRHEGIMRRAIEEACGIPVLGAVPRMADYPFPERHLGLTPPQEHDHVTGALRRAATVAEDCLDLERLGSLAGSAPPLAEGDDERPDGVRHPGTARRRRPETQDDGRPVIGIIRDSAFQFYYPENLEALAARGASLVEISACTADALPEIDALYIGGGFPETHARTLAENGRFRQALRQSVEDGLPVYAECGGLVYLGETLTVGTETFPMAGVLPVAFGMERKPQGHGYTRLEVTEANPFFPVGTTLKGHEFHYARLLDGDAGGAAPCCRVVRGGGIDGRGDGLVANNCLALFTHLHAAGEPRWAEALVKQAVRHRRTRSRRERDADRAAQGPAAFLEDRAGTGRPYGTAL
jgi:cobyrinic acid a,c-diamide synthase